MAHWIRPEGAQRNSYRYKCSACGHVCHQVTGNCGAKEANKIPEPACDYKFCPYCGERMDVGMNVFEKALEESYLQQLKAATDGMYRVFQELQKAGFEKQDALTLMIAMMQNGKKAADEDAR